MRVLNTGEGQQREVRESWGGAPLYLDQRRVFSDTEDRPLRRFNTNTNTNTDTDTDTGTNTNRHCGVGETEHQEVDRVVGWAQGRGRDLDRDRDRDREQDPDREYSPPRFSRRMHQESRSPSPSRPPSPSSSSGLFSNKPLNDEPSVALVEDPEDLESPDYEEDVPVQPTVSGLPGLRRMPTLADPELNQESRYFEAAVCAPSAPASVVPGKGEVSHVVMASTCLDVNPTYRGFLKAHSQAWGLWLAECGKAEGVGSVVAAAAAAAAAAPSLSTVMEGILPKVGFAGVLSCAEWTALENALGSSGDHFSASAADPEVVPGQVMDIGVGPNGALIGVPLGVPPVSVCYGKLRPGDRGTPLRSWQLPQALVAKARVIFTAGTMVAVGTCYSVPCVRKGESPPDTSTPLGVDSPEQAAALLEDLTGISPGDPRRFFWPSQAHGVQLTHLLVAIRNQVACGVELEARPTVVGLGSHRCGLSLGRRAGASK